jgi:hypothetical protein
MKLITITTYILGVCGWGTLKGLTALVMRYPCQNNDRKTNLSNFVNTNPGANLIKKFWSKLDHLIVKGKSFTVMKRYKLQ